MSVCMSRRGGGGLGSDLSKKCQITGTVLLSSSTNPNHDPNPYSYPNHRFYWWEPYNMMRRLALTCGATLCNSLGETTVFVIFVSVVTLVIEREARPHISLFLSGFTYCMLWQILLFVLFMLLLDAEITGKLGNIVISSLLVS